MALDNPFLNQPVGQILKGLELVSEGQIQEALLIQRKQGGLFGEILIALGYISHDELVLALAEQKGVDVRDLHEQSGGGPSLIS